MRRPYEEIYQNVFKHICCHHVLKDMRNPWNAFHPEKYIKLKIY